MQPTLQPNLHVCDHHHDCVTCSWASSRSMQWSIRNSLSWSNLIVRATIIAIKLACCFQRDFLPIGWSSDLLHCLVMGSQIVTRQLLTGWFGYPCAINFQNVASATQRLAVCWPTEVLDGRKRTDGDRLLRIIIIMTWR
jgi:hypothetical protein